jgi:hypothetical protein
MPSRMVAFVLDVGVVNYSSLVPADEQVLCNSDCVFLVGYRRC